MLNLGLNALLSTYIVSRLIDASLCMYGLSNMVTMWCKHCRTINYCELLVIYCKYLGMVNIKLNLHEAKLRIFLSFYIFTKKKSQKTPCQWWKKCCLLRPKSAENKGGYCFQIFWFVVVCECNMKTNIGLVNQSYSTCQPFCRWQSCQCWALSQGRAASVQLGLVWMALSHCEHHATKHISLTGVFLFVRNVERERDENKKIILSSFF